MKRTAPQPLHSSYVPRDIMLPSPGCNGDPCIWGNGLYVNVNAGKRIRVDKESPVVQPAPHYPVGSHGEQYSDYWATEISTALQTEQTLTFDPTLGSLPDDTVRAIKRRSRHRPIRAMREACSDKCFAILAIVLLVVVSASLAALVVVLPPIPTY